MPVPSSALPIPDLRVVDDDDFLQKIAAMLDRLRAQSEMRGHPLLATLLALAKDEAEDDLRTRATDFANGGFPNDADESVRRMAQRFACGRRADDAEEPRGPAELLAFLRG